MPDTHYENSKLAELYDIDSPWSVDRDFYLSLAKTAGGSVLDLGCGTGLLCNAYAARGHDVTGVDPSSAMLAVGRRKPNGDRIEWVQSSAQLYRSNKRFDLIIMTGHAFQVLLSDEDILAAFSTMRSHLKPQGIAAFESRNPAIDWTANWNYDMTFELSGNQIYEKRRLLEMNNDQMTFELLYEFPDETLRSESHLRFLAHYQIETLMREAGLQLEKLLGDWDEKPFGERTSEEMIFIASKSAK